jgi:hypothetical protein
MSAADSFYQDQWPFSQPMPAAGMPVRRLSPREEAEALAAWRNVFAAYQDDSGADPDSLVVQIGQRYGLLGVVVPSLKLADSAMTELGRTGASTIHLLTDAISRISDLSPGQEQMCSRLMLVMLAHKAGFQDEMMIDDYLVGTDLVTVPRLVAATAVLELADILGTGAVEVFDMLVGEDGHDEDQDEHSLHITNFLRTVGQLVDSAGLDIRTCHAQLQSWCGQLDAALLQARLLNACQQADVLAGWQAGSQDSPVPAELGTVDVVLGALARLDGQQPCVHTARHLLGEHCPSCVAHALLWLLHQRWDASGDSGTFGQFLARLDTDLDD